MTPPWSPPDPQPGGDARCSPLDLPGGGAALPTTGTGPRRRRTRPSTEVTGTWRQRISAPVETVADTLPLAAILAGFAGLTAEVGLGEDTARVALHLRWGPLTRVVPGHATLTLHPVGAAANHPVVAVVHLPALALEYRCQVQLASSGTDVTTLRAHGHLRCSHRVVRRCAALLNPVVEDHLRAVAATATRRAESRHQAHHRLNATATAARPPRTRTRR